MKKEQQQHTPSAAPLIMLGDAEQANEVTIEHAKTGRDFKVYYRDPTSAERIAYANSIVSRKGKKVKIDNATADLRGGVTVITGIADGVLATRDPKTGTIVPISTDKESKDFNPGWKKLVQDSLTQELMLLGRYVFGGSTISVEEDAVEDGVLGFGDDDQDQEESLPNSTQTSPQ